MELAIPAPGYVAPLMTEPLNVNWSLPLMPSARLPVLALLRQSRVSVFANVMKPDVARLADSEPRPVTYRGQDRIVCGPAGLSRTARGVPVRKVP